MLDDVFDQGGVETRLLCITARPSSHRPKRALEGDRLVSGRGCARWTWAGGGKFRRLAARGPTPAVALAMILDLLTVNPTFVSMEGESEGEGTSEKCKSYALGLSQVCSSAVVTVDVSTRVLAEEQCRV